jgi:hypothetical protein
VSSQDLVVGLRLARGRWVVVALARVAVLGQAAIGALGGAFGSMLRRVPRTVRRASRDLVTAPNKLALGRAHAVRQGLHPEADPQVALGRTEIERLRAQ